MISRNDTNKQNLYNKKMRIAPSIIDLIENSNVQYDTPDHKNHKIARDGFINYRGRVGIDNVIFNYIVRIGKNNGNNMFYDINLEVEQILPSVKNTSGIKGPTSNEDSIAQKNDIVNTIIQKNLKMIQKNH